MTVNLMNLSKLQKQKMTAKSLKLLKKANLRRHKVTVSCHRFDFEYSFFVASMFSKKKELYWKKDLELW